MREETLYKMSEIAMAAKLSTRTLYERREKLGIPSNRRGYTFEQAKLLVKPPPKPQYTSSQKALRLRKMLIDDGYLGG